MDPNLSTIRARRADLIKARQAIDDEEKELEIAERVLTRLATTSPQRNIVAPAPKEPITPSVTHGDLVKATLRMSETPWFDSTETLREEIKRIHGVEIKATSLQPLISLMKRDGVIVRDGQRIALPERVRPEGEKNQAAEGASSAA